MTLFGISLIEWFGYAASVVVALSLTMASIVKLRWYNLVGAAMFSSYGFVIGALPVGFLNLFIVVIDIWYIVRMYREQDDFKILAMTGGDEFRDYYLDCHREEIARIFPGFKFDDGEGRLTFYLLKNSVPIGLLIGRRQGEALVIELDYVGVQYRDFRMGAFVYGSRDFFHGQGIRRLVCPAGAGLHDRYLEKMKFIRTGEIYEKAL